MLQRELKRVWQARAKRREQLLEHLRFVRLVDDDLEVNIVRCARLAEILHGITADERIRNPLAFEKGAHLIEGLFKRVHLP
jgi:hypothetical protein